MKALALWAAATALLCCSGTESHAIARTFVASNGAGVACTRAAPCATFQLAHDATDPNGEINCIDAGNFGPVTITKSITIDCAGTVGSIGTSSTDAIIVGIAGISVRLRNLTLEGFDAGFIGVNVLGAAALFVENCVFDGFNIAVSFLPGDSINTKLLLSDSILRRSALEGVRIGPTPNPNSSPRATLDGVRLERNLIGIRATGAFADGVSIAHVRNSVVTGSAGSGIQIDANHNNVISVTVDRTSVTLSQIFGVSASGTGTFVTLGRSTVMSNVTGLASGSGGNILSYRNNHLTGNVTDGAPTAALTLR